jgi:hypothetical protein|tara:strand:+ start:6391 stop:6558 length:168 start_codon:yes stop_codon:yes gene_type:complete
MIELTRDEALAILDELANLPYKQVQPLVITLVNKISEVPEEPQAKEFQEPIYTGE